MTARPNNTDIAVAPTINVATMRARRGVSTATQVAAKTLPPIAICPMSDTEKVSVKIVTPHAQISIVATTASNPKTMRDKTKPLPAAAETSTCNPAKKTNAELATTLGPPSGSGVAGNQRQARMATSNAPCVHAARRGSAVAFGIQGIVVIAPAVRACSLAAEDGGRGRSPNRVREP